jgi:site-specific DNA-methyltransferase (adenine-specific)
METENKMKKYELHLGSNLEVLPKLADCSVDAIVTDPPYELGFMGKAWDASGIAYNVGLWRECLRVLKPGGHILAFSGSRTYHRMACAIEDAGFEIRDQMLWVYGSGFPKSHNISKAIDKAAGQERETVGFKSAGIGTGKSYGKIVGEREKVKTNLVAVTAPATEAAKQWDGWGTALKPAHEPICLARKPIEGTVADNVLKWGTGGINIDACRVGEIKGRFPANLMHDGSQEVVELFPGEEGSSAARFFYCPKASKSDRDEGCELISPANGNTFGKGIGSASGSDVIRKNNHPTVKPTELMRYLCRLITPPGGIVLDPFTGSGSTGKAALIEGFYFIGIELSAEYAEIARHRIEGVSK